MGSRVFRLFLLPTAAAVAAVLLSAQPASSIHNTSALYPDLKTLEPVNFGITMSSGEQRLTMDIEAVDADTGPLELWQTNTKCDPPGPDAEGRIAKQRIYNDGGDGGFTRNVDTGFTEREAGCMRFHRAHHHRHFGDFYLLELKDLFGSLVANGVKETFCIADVNDRSALFSWTEPFAPATRYYSGCTSRKSAQGLSVGWGDLYPKGTTGQYVVVNAVPNGTYCFWATADPLNKIWESAAGAGPQDSLADNTNDAKIAIGTNPATGNRTVSYVGPSCSS